MHFHPVILLRYVKKSIKMSLANYSLLSTLASKHVFPSMCKSRILHVKYLRQITMTVLMHFLRKKCSYASFLRTSHVQVKKK
jgi:type II secretory pathway component PulJ